MRVYDNWISDAEAKAQKVWESLRELEFAEATLAVASKVQHDSDVARAFEDLVTFSEMRDLREDFLGCINKEDLLEVQQ